MIKKNRSATTNFKKRTSISIREDISVRTLQSEANGSNPCRATKLRALARIADGERVNNVAADFSVSTSSIYSWIKCLNSQGLSAFKKQPQRGRPRQFHCRLDLDPEQLEISAKTADVASQKRLHAISRVLRGEEASFIARSMGVSPSAISEWIKRFNDGGIGSLIGRKGRQPVKTRTMRRDVSLSELRREAREAKFLAQLCTSRRLTAITLVLGGATLSEVARKLEISVASVSKWCKTFNLMGIQGLIGKNDAKKTKKHSIRNFDYVKG